MNRGRPFRWLAVLPAAAIFLGVPFANRIHTYVLGMPFLLAWIVGCVVFTSVSMAIVGALDRRADADGRP